MAYPPLVQQLIQLLSQLPSVGPKTAERYIFYLLEQKPELIKPLAHHLEQLSQTLTTCSECGAITLSDPCPICRDPQRSTAILCIVATNQDLEAIETTGSYLGRYLVLGGYLDTLNGIKPTDLRLETLLKYLQKNKWHGHISRLARGLATGTNLEYTDPLTLANALKFRQEINN